jgi:hypothetical protein
MAITGGSNAPWTQAPTFPKGNSSITGVAIDCWYRTVQTGDPGATLTCTFTQSNQKAVMVVETFSGANQTPDQSSGKWNNAAATALTTNSVTPSVNNCLIVTFYTQRDSSIATTYLTSDGSTERDDRSCAGSSEVAAGTYDLAQVTAAAISGSNTASQSLDYCAGILALSPATTVAFATLGATAMASGASTGTVVVSASAAVGDLMVLWIGYGGGSPVLTPVPPPPVAAFLPPLDYTSPIWLAQRVTHVDTAAAAGPQNYQQSLAGSLSFIGLNNTLTARHLVAASLSFVGAQAQSTRKSLTAGLSFIGAYAKLARDTETGSLSFIGTQNRAVSETKTGSLSFIGTVTKRTITSRAGSLSFIGAVTKRTATTRTGSVSFVGNLTTAVVHFFTQVASGSLSFVGVITKRTATTRTGSLSFIGVQTRSVGHLLAGSLSFIGNLATAGAGHFFQALTGSLSFIGVQTRRTGSGQVGSVSFIGAQTRRIGSGQTGSLSFIGAIAKRTATIRTGSVSFIGNLTTAVAHFFTQAVSGSLSFVGTRTAIHTFGKALTGSLSFVGAQSRRTAHTMSAAATFTGTILRRIPAKFTAALSFVGGVVGIPSGALQPKPPFSLANRETASAMTAMTTTGGDVNGETARAGLNASTGPATAPTGTETGTSSMTTTVIP